MNKLLIASSLSIGYQKNIQSDLNFVINRGSFSCLMGKNGCGKSTLLKTLGGLIDSLSGEISIDSSILGQISSSQLSRFISVVLTQKMSLPNRSVREVLSLGRTPYLGVWGKLTQEDHQVVEEISQQFQLRDLMDKLFDTLSDGQKQKVLIARAFVQDTPLVILDEPTTFLDVRQRYEVMLKIKELAAKRDVAVLFSSHDWELALDICDNVWLMDRGLEIAMPEELILNGSIEKSFAGNVSVMDKHKGGFAPRHIMEKQVSLAGDDCHAVRWTKHALQKNGVGVDREASAQIFAFQGEWKLTQNGSSTAFSRLQDLIDHLSKSL